MSTFSERLKELRTSKSVTQGQMAELLGITERNYQRYEYGLLDLTASNTTKLADYFSVITNEHVIGFLKRFRILSERCRNCRKRFGLRLSLIASICNMDRKAA